MSMLIFSNLVERARAKLSRATSITVPVEIKTTANLVVFVAEHVHLLEEQLGASQNQVASLKLENSRMLKINAQLCNILEDKGFDKEEIQKIIDYVK